MSACRWNVSRRTIILSHDGRIRFATPVEISPSEAQTPFRFRSFRALPFCRRRTAVVPVAHVQILTAGYRLRHLKRPPSTLHYYERALSAFRGISCYPPKTTLRAPMSRTRVLSYPTAEPRHPIPGENVWIALDRWIGKKDFQEEIHYTAVGFNENENSERIRNRNSFKAIWFDRIYIELNIFPLRWWSIAYSFLIFFFQGRTAISDSRRKRI